MVLPIDIFLRVNFAAPAAAKASTSRLRGEEDVAVGTDDLLGSLLSLVALPATAVEEDCLLSGGAVLGEGLVVAPIPLRDVQEIRWILSLYCVDPTGADQRNVRLFTPKVVVVPPT